MNVKIPFLIKAGTFGYVTVETSSKFPEEMEPEAVDAAIRALQTHKRARYNIDADGPT